MDDRWFRLGDHGRYPPYMTFDRVQHDLLYQRLQQIRLDWCTSFTEPFSSAPLDEYLLDVSSLQNIPDFYIRLGEVMNGANGYYGGCLDSLEDCLCGGFGIVPPFTLRIKNSKYLAAGFGDDAIDSWIASSKNETYDQSEINDLRDAPQHRKYLAKLVDILQTCNVSIIYD